MGVGAAIIARTITTYLNETKYKKVKIPEIHKMVLFAQQPLIPLSQKWFPFCEQYKVLLTIVGNKCKLV